MTRACLQIAAEVQQAMASGQPVVALETSIWCQGLPYPESIAGARRVDRAVRAAGAVPAVLGLERGVIRVGLEDAELEVWCRERDAVKAGARDLGVVLARRERAATTVSACLAICSMAGIGVLATGGIGGVHRGAAETFDISTDLPWLAQSGVCVVSSGVKSILDVAATLEYLETLGVPVIGFESTQLPVFYSRTSPYAVQTRCDTVQEVAEVVRAHRAAGLRTGLLVANPVPVEHEIPAQEVEAWTAAALEAAATRGLRGKAVTPFLLAWLHEASGGRSLAANLALIEGNAALAACLAGALCSP